MGLLAIFFWRPWDIRWPVIWGERWGLLVLGLGVLLIWKLRWRSKIFPISLTYLLAVTVASGFMMGFHPNPPGLAPLPLGLRISSLAPLSILLTFLTFIHLRLNLRIELRWVSLVLLLAIMVSPHPTRLVYLMDNPSMAATAVVLCSAGAPWMLPGLLAIVFTHSYTAFLVFLVSFFYHFRHRWKLLLPAAAAMAAFFYVTVHRIPDNGRLAMWGDYTKFWWRWDWSMQWFQIPMDPLRKWLVHWFGMGLGTTWTYFPLMRLGASPGDYAMVSNWLHNDWLQALPETGIVGACLLVFSAAKLLHLANEKQRGELLAFYVAMLTNFPLHYVVPAIVVWSLIGEIGVDDAVQIESPDAEILGARKTRQNEPKNVRRVGGGNALHAQVARTSAPQKGPRTWLH